MKSRTLHIRHALFLCAFFFGIVGESWGQVTRTTVATGDWNATSTWSGGVVPASNDVVRIAPGHTITVTADASCASINLVYVASGTSSGTSTLIVNSNVTLTVSGAINITSVNSDIDNNYSKTANIQGSGSILCGSISVGSVVTPYADESNTLNSTISNLSCSGTLTIYSSDNTSSENNATFNLQSGTVEVASVSMTAQNSSGTASTATLSLVSGAQSGTLKINGDTPFSTSGTGTITRTLNGTSSTVEYNRAGDQTVLNTTYRNLTINGSGVKTTGGATTVAGTLTVNSGATIATTSTLTTSSTATINGSFQLNSGGWVTNGTWSYGSSGTIIFNSTSSYTVNNTDVFWPTTNGPVNVSILQGGLTLSSASRTVTGTFQTAAGVTLTSTTLTLNGTCRINSGGFFNQTPTYGPSSTLVYNTNYGTSNEWTGGASTSVAAGSGVPANVTVESGTVTLSGGRGVPGNITVNSSCGLVLNNSSGDLFIGGNLTNNGSTWTNNSRAVRFVGTGTSLITNGGGTQFFDYLLIEKNSGSVQLGSGSNVTINTTSGDVLQLLNAASLDLNGRTLTLANTNGNISTNGSDRTITSGVSGGTVSITGNKFVTGTGTLIFGSNVIVALAAGLDFGASKSTINGTLQINSGGFVNTNAPTYASGSTLKYNSGGTYGRGTEWSATSGAGYPHHVQVSNATTLNVANGSNSARQIAGDMIIDANSTVSMEGLTNNSFTVGLTVLGNIANSGNITMATTTERLKCTDFTNNVDATTTLSNTIGGDMEITGNILDNGAFYSNSRAIFFTEGIVQNISGSGTFNIDYIVSNKSGGSIKLLSNLLCEGSSGGNAMTLTNSSDVLDLNGYTFTINGAISGSGQINASSGTVAFGNASNLSLPTSLFTGNVANIAKTAGAGTVTLNDNLTITGDLTTTAITGAFVVAASKELTINGTLTNDGTFTLKDGATLVQGTSGTSITGTGTYNVEKALIGNSATWNSTSGRFWYMGVPMVNVARSSFGNNNINSNRLWSYSELSKQYHSIALNDTSLSAGTGLVHRRATNETLTFSATGANGLYGSDLTLNGLTRTAGVSAGYHLIANPYMAYIDWNAVTKTNVETTYYIRSASPSDNSALISYNSSGPNYVSNGVLNIDDINDVRYIAPMQSIWVRVGTASATGSLGMTRSMLSHQSSNPGLKNTTIFPTLARVNLVDGARFDQMLVFMNQDMSNGVDQFDSEKMFVNGAPQIYTMAAGKKLVMNGLKNNKKKISVPLYLELPESKVYNLQLAEYILEEGLILLEDKQEGIIQDFTIHDTYAFYANSGLLQNRFVLHFFAPDNGITAQGPSNSWVENETSYTEGGSILIQSDSKGKVQITLDQPETENVDGSVQVMDANGRNVYMGQLEGLFTEFTLNVPSGIYYLTVQSGNDIENKKVFIQE